MDWPEYFSGNLIVEGDFKPSRIQPLFDVIHFLAFSISVISAHAGIDQ